MPRWTIALALLPMLRASHAVAAEPVGVWIGTLGPAKIAACFEATGAAAYYYVKHGVDIPLRRTPPGAWEEDAGRGKVTGMWSVELRADGALGGRWTSPDGKRTLPIALAPAAAGAGPSFCQSTAYKAPLTESNAVVPAKDESVMQLELQTVRLLGDKLQGIKVVGDDPAHVPIRKAIDRLNRKLERGYDECMELAGQRDADYSGELEAVAVSQHFVVLALSTEFYCGGAHPDSELAAFVFDRATGKPIDIATWFTVPPDTLGRQIWKPKGKRCADVAVHDDPFIVWPTSAGMAFRPVFGHALAGCARTTVLPYARLRDNLSPAGQHATHEIAGAR